MCWVLSFLSISRCLLHILLLTTQACGPCIYAIFQIVILKKFLCPTVTILHVWDFMPCIKTQMLLPLLACQYTRYEADEGKFQVEFTGFPCGTAKLKIESSPSTSSLDAILLLSITDTTLDAKMSLKNYQSSRKDQHQLRLLRTLNNLRLIFMFALH